VYETDEDIAHLSQLIQSSHARAGAFLRDSFEIPDKSLNAQQLIRHLQGMVTLVMATVTKAGEPRAAPVVGCLYRGSFCIPSVGSALRSRHIRVNSAVSLSLYEGNDFAIIVHGSASFVIQDDAEFTDLVGIQTEHEGSDVRSWGDEPLFIRVSADRLYSFARYPDRFPSE
jgi:hypothetical protein